MIFYIAVDSDGKKHVFTVEADAKKVDKSYTQVDQPNDKVSLKALIQESFDEIFKLEQQLKSTRLGLVVEVEDVGPAPLADFAEQTRPLAPQGVASDGHPHVREAWTSQQIDAMFTKRSEHVQDICWAISRLHGPDLGYVAFQVAAQMTHPITIVVEGEESQDGP